MPDAILPIFQIMMSALMGITHVTPMQIALILMVDTSVNVFLVLMEMASIAQVRFHNSSKCYFVLFFVPDIDECADSNQNNCSANANCTDNFGNYECTCLEGYTGDGFMCEDVDECSYASPCSPNANCSNTEGSYLCYCMVGFTGDGMACDGMVH